MLCYEEKLCGVLNTHQVILIENRSSVVEKNPFILQFHFSPSLHLSHMIIDNPKIVNGIDIGVRAVEIIEDSTPLYHGYLNHGNVPLMTKCDYRKHKLSFSFIQILMHIIDSYPMICCVWLYSRENRHMNDLVNNINSIDCFMDRKHIHSISNQFYQSSSSS